MDHQNSFCKASNILEINHHAQMFQDWELSYNQISTGQFKSSLDSLTFNNIDLYRECFSTSIFQQGAARRNCLNLGLYVDHKIPIIWQGRHLKHNEIIAIMGNKELMLMTPEESVCLGLSIPISCFEDATKEKLLTGFTIQKEIEVTIYPKIGTLVNTLLSHPMLVATERTRTQIQDDLLDLIIQSIDHQPEKIMVSTQKATSVVNRVIEYTHSHCDQLFAISDLCSITNTSRRTLQSCFEKSTGMSPALFLKYLRLNKVRKELAQITANSSISTIATHFGFWHLSQFAYDYKRLFLESPSDTLKSNQKIQKYI
ncbi:helix-turn-helix domain-containing protein [Acinetobacter boissieri]|uniref:AraC family transcriptional regulator, ethanolamine operon transcriptional activator n=1 Tax=Acinetobacter boissieri TaxID=1219383 RepID=A0A1G6HL44_9GAMM|nr:helix-turn-helix domain-containing protein [Acinetobacter boissieri]SDB94625.1 AraC family transcriptional regulator, ethanolamine operon transcriptional activator [Acinetobacter boissieri]